MIDYSQLSPKEKLDLWMQKQNTSEESFSALEDRIAAKQLAKESIPETEEVTPKVKPVRDQNRITKEIDSLDIEQGAKDYLKRLAKVESSYNPGVVNSHGFMGLYQFKAPSLNTVGMSQADYMASSMNQHKAALTLASKNLSILEPFIGQSIRGIKLTKYNLAAAAHLGGAGHVKEVLMGQRPDFLDGNGTSIFRYLREFS